LRTICGSNVPARSLGLDPDRAGHFIDPSKGVRSSKDAEAKWFQHPAGDKRPEWTADDQRTTLVVLVEGGSRIDLTEASVTLEKQGGYLTWAMNRPLREALSDFIVITIRWPSATT
jgi:hypothetical protein